MVRTLHFAILPGVALSLLIASHTAADIRVVFVESAPKDRFQITNIGNCPVTDTTIALDLSTSNGALIFDVQENGKGVGVVQPFELVEGADALRSVPSVSDGQSTVALDLTSLEPDQSVAFTIDVDDTLSNRQITVSKSEIEGATVQATTGEASLTATFTDSGVASLPLATC